MRKRVVELLLIGSIVMMTGCGAQESTVQTQETEVIEIQDEDVGKAEEIQTLQEIESEEVSTDTMVK